MKREEWDRIQAQYEQDVKSIVIPEWPTESLVKNVAAHIDKIYTKAFFDFGRARIADDNVNRTIEKISKMNLVGNNESDRKRNSVTAVANHVIDGIDVDLYDIQEETNRRLVFMESVIKSLDAKLRILTIAYGALKIESNLHK